MTYCTESRPAALKNLKRFPKRVLVRIRKRIEELGNSLPDSKTTKMRGKNSFHRVRSGNYSIIYEIHSDRLVNLIVKVAHRMDVYGNLT